MRGILDVINALYTVYTRLFVYDRNGRVVAASRLGSDDALPRAVDPGTLERVLALDSDQAYHVSAFESTPFYGGRPTYIYHAAIRHPEQENQVVGGIGIVFDGSREFEAMLRGGLNRDDTVSAYFIDRQGHIISRTDTARDVGATLPVAADVLALTRGSSLSRVVEQDGHYAVMGCAASQGYREFKVSDGYVEDVIAVVFQPLGAVQSGSALLQGRQIAIEDAGFRSAAPRETYATFFCGGDLLALPARHMLEALPASALSARSSGVPGRLGMLAPQDNSQIRHFVWVYDLTRLLHGREGTLAGGAQIVIVRHGMHTAGLLVDALHAVPEFGDAQRMASPFGSESNRRLVSHFIKANQGELLIQLVDPAALFVRLQSLGQEAQATA